MAENYDVIVIGAGPSGLMTALRAAESGLKVVILEKFRDVFKIKRACSQQFMLDKGFEKENLEVKPGKIIFPNNGFEVDYDGLALPIIDFYHISPKGHRVHYANKDRSPSAIKFDKGRLLKNIWEKCESAGVKFRTGTVAYDATDSSTGVEVNLTCNGAKSTIKGQKIIAADGVNSRITETLGMNKERKFFVAAPCIIYFVEGLKDFKNTEWKYYHMGHPFKITVIIEPSIEGENIGEIVIQGSKARPPEQIYHDISTKGPLAYMFEGAKVVGKWGCVCRIYSSILVPHKDNALIIGDAAACVEVETQGAIMCGFHGGNAVVKELRGENGFEEYTQWWQDSMEFHSEEELRWASSTFSAANVYTDDELDYLFSLAEDETLEGSYSQWKHPRLMWGSILRHKEKIKKERPEIYQKIEKFHEFTFKELWSKGSQKFPKFDL